MVPVVNFSLLLTIYELRTNIEVPIVLLFDNQKYSFSSSNYLQSTSNCAAITQNPIHNLVKKTSLQFTRRFFSEST